MTLAERAAGVLREGISLLGVPDPEQVAATMEKYLDEILRWNPRFGLVKADSEQDLVVKHVLDSLAAWRIVREEARGGRVLDVGSGAGFPGIPLAVALPDIGFTLLERSEKRASFLRTCKVLLGLARTEVVAGDLGSVRGTYDVVTFRAVAPLSRFFDEAGRAGLRFSRVAAYKGRARKVEEEIEDVRRSTSALCEARIVPLSVPFLHEERCVALLHVSSLLTKG